MSRLTRTAGLHLRRTYRLLRGNRHATEEVHREVKETHRATRQLHPLLDLFDIRTSGQMRELPQFLREMLTDILDALQGAWRDLREMKTTIAAIPGQLDEIRAEQEALRRRQEDLAAHLGQQLD